MIIPRIMSTQHPDNVNFPSFSHKPVMEADEEVEEAFHTFSELGAEEQLWDAEGKETDAFVVQKLLTRYTEYFRQNVLGKDKFLTLRVPNPDVEKNEGKILLEALHSIPRNFDVGKAFYQQPVAPIFEVVLPMCSSEKNLVRVHEYYKNFIIKNQHRKLYQNDITVAQWLGELNPRDIRVTPLFETKEAILNCDKYVRKYITKEKIKELQRVWFARSDPALNYGSTSAVLLGKIGVQKMYELQEKLSLDILPILGCGSAPFRGNFTPLNAKSMLFGYPSIQTFTIQSAFKYDYPEARVKEAIEEIKATKRKAPLPVDEKGAIRLINKMEEDYQKSIRLIAETVNRMSQFVPPRRKRKLHIGLFGYSRQAGSVHLPRAITFAASLYSLGLPPDILGLAALKEQEIDRIRESYRTIDLDMADALQYLNKNNLHLFPPAIKERVAKVCSLFQYEENSEHSEMTTAIGEAFSKQQFSALQEKIIAAGKIRNFLG